MCLSGRDPIGTRTLPGCPWLASKPRDPSLIVRSTEELQQESWKRLGQREVFDDQQPCYGVTRSEDWWGSA
jgi:hypothetical protein